MNEKKEKINTKFKNSKKYSDNSDNGSNQINLEDGFSSVSNPHSPQRTLISSSNVSSNLINLKNKNLKSHGAYILTETLKKDYLSIHTIDLSDNNLEDEGIMYLSMSLRLCTFLKSLNLSNNNITDYGIRILFENLNYGYLKYLNISGNSFGNRGAEHIAQYIPNIHLEHLALNSAGIDEQGSKAIGFALTSNSSIKILELSWNNIKLTGAVFLSRGLMTNYCLQELYISYNNFGIEGVTALSDCLKINKTIQLVDLNNNRLSYDCAKTISQSLRVNSTLLSLNMSFNNITSAGIYEILSAINNDKSRLEYLGLKNIPIQKHLILIIELIQQRRKFQCDYGTLILYPDSILPRTNSDDESMIKLARYLSEKRMRLVDMFRILDKQNKLEMDKTEFVRRMKIFIKLFEPRLTQRDINNIAKSLSKQDTIYYSTLFTQMTKPRPDNQFEINRKKAILNEEEDRFLNKINKNIKINSFNNLNQNKDLMIDQWLENQNGSDFAFDSESDLKKDLISNTNNTTKSKFSDKKIDEKDKFSFLIKKSKTNNIKTENSKSEPKLTNGDIENAAKTSNQPENSETKSRIPKYDFNLSKNNNYNNNKNIYSFKPKYNQNLKKSVNENFNNTINNQKKTDTNLIERKALNYSSIETSLL